MPDGTPDLGITIYMDSDKDNIISIFEGISPNMYRDETYSEEDGDTIYKLITFDDKDENPAYRYVHIRAEKKFYTKNKKGIKKDFDF